MSAAPAQIHYLPGPGRRVACGLTTPSATTVNRTVVSCAACLGARWRYTWLVAWNNIGWIVRRDALPSGSVEDCKHCLRADGVLHYRTDGCAYGVDP